MRSRWVYTILTNTSVIGYVRKKADGLYIRQAHSGVIKFFTAGRSIPNQIIRIVATLVCVI